MSISKQILTSAFRTALWAGIGAGLMSSFDSARLEQHEYPSLTDHDASKLHHHQVGLVAGVTALLVLENMLGERKGAAKARGAAPT